MNEQHPFKPIAVPANWDATKDIEDYEARFGPSDNHFAEVLARIAENHSELEGLVAQSLAYFGDSEKDIRSLPLDAKLARLKRWVSSGTPERRYTERMFSLIDLSLKVLDEHEAITRKYASPNEALWLHPLSDLADWISTAEFKLREGMECEHGDFPAE